MSDQHPHTDPRAATMAALAAGEHDEALVHLVAGAAAPDPRTVLAGPAWDDERFLAWWMAEQRACEPRATRRTSDAEALDAGRAFQARALARRLAIPAWYQRRPALAAPIVAGPPAQVLGTAALMQHTPVVDLAVAAGIGCELWDEEASAWLAIPTELPAGRYLALRIAGDSMEPVMHTGDTVLVALGAPVRAGETIVARHPEDGYVCKRVRRVRAATVELESLAPGRPLIVIPRDPALVVGRVVAVWCHHCAAPSAGPSVRAAGP